MSLEKSRNMGALATHARATTPAQSCFTQRVANTCMEPNNNGVHSHTLTSLGTHNVGPVKAWMTAGTRYPPMAYCWSCHTRTSPRRQGARTTSCINVRSLSTFQA